MHRSSNSSPWQHQQKHRSSNSSPWQHQQQHRSFNNSFPVFGGTNGSTGLLTQVHGGTNRSTGLLTQVHRGTNVSTGLLTQVLIGIHRFTAPIFQLILSSPWRHQWKYRFSYSSQPPWLVRNLELNTLYQKSGKSDQQCLQKRGKLHKFVGDLSHSEHLKPVLIE